jgi:hypothetical protein
MLATHENERYVSACPSHIAFGAEESWQSRAEQNERIMARSEQSLPSRKSRDGGHDTRDLSISFFFSRCRVATGSSVCLLGLEYLL